MKATLFELRKYVVVPVSGPSKMWYFGRILYLIVLVSIYMFFLYVIYLEHSRRLCCSNFANMLSYLCLVLQKCGILEGFYILLLFVFIYMFSLFVIYLEHS